ncbi:MAG: hypothetical protein PHN85_05480 [Kiritimatiellae bacterium]|nr:hypothetical protein [Kiritimatiellia bacterium]
MRLETSHERIDPARDLMLTITVEAPSHLEVKLPDLRDRFSGFSTAEDFFMPPTVSGGRALQTHRWRLTPEPAAERYRLAPFAVEVLDKSHEPPQVSHFATKPVLFPAPPARPPVTGEPEVTPEPVWIPPTAKSVSLWILTVIAAAALVAAALYGLTRLSRRVREYRMSPVERAMTELQRLLNRNLPAKGLFKEFYIELTMVVRRYIEREHGIRAPEQTTQEFLAAAASQPAFTPETVAQLKTFLESADLVKFAGREATVDMAEDATSKARTYISSDAPQVSGKSEKLKR